jgi:hypothetical protein
MKTKKWARKARTVIVHLEGRERSGSASEHLIEIRDARARTLRNRTIEYRNERPSISAIMIDVQARLSRNSLVVDPDSYAFAHGGKTLRATVSVPPPPHTAP